MRLVDDIIGIEELEIAQEQDEHESLQGECLSPKISLRTLQQQSDIFFGLA